MYVPTANETMRPSRTDSVIFCTSSENTCRPTVLEPLLSLHVREAYEDRTMRREYRGRQRNNNIKTFPYEPLVMGGRLVMPAELQRVHRAVLGGAQITDDMRAVVEKRWPELIAKLPPRSGYGPKLREALRRTACRLTLLFRGLGRLPNLFPDLVPILTPCGGRSSLTVCNLLDQPKPD